MPPTIPPSPVIGTGTPENVAVSPNLDRTARLLREALTHARRDVRCPLKDAHIENLQRRIENDRTRPCQHIMTVLHDAFSRGAPREDVEQFARTLLALIASWYEPKALPDLHQLLLMESHAESEARPATLAVALTPTTKAIADASDRLHTQLMALERLVEGLDRVRMVA